jgi:hypothetical protein
MSSADDLFGGGKAAPPPPDPVAEIRRLLAIAAVASFLCCPVVFLPFTSLFALYTWHRAGEELDRARRGEHPAAIGPELRALRRASAWLVLLDCGLMFLALSGYGFLASQRERLLEMLPTG